MTIAARLSKGFFYFLLLPAVLGLTGWQSWAWWSWASAPVLSPAQAAGTAPQDNLVQLEIPEGTTAQQIGRDLHSAGLIRSPLAWNLWTRWQTLQNREGSFQAGIYELSPTEPLSAIADMIWQGEVMQRSFTIPEGWSMQQMADYFQEQGHFTAEEFLAATQQIPRDQFPWLPDGIPHLEGFLYPDTYKFTGKLTPDAVIDQMLERFQQVALPIYQQAQGNTPYTLLQWVTLASIVEREAVISTERPQIASVFARRLREGIPLGADPTVEYALGIRQTPDQPLTFDQVATPSPYNTYQIIGLPPTPISSPGVASLEASLNPADTEYLYFVARYDGTHVFSRTLAEHEAAQAAIHDRREAATPTPDTSTPSTPAPNTPAPN
ncbi:MAG: endolytic transglycosylase MltG [Synechococcales cyanobacterium M58_A2018_015]|nr:endolytic transglycosylase MltG [Synechococcales cyanobacterium M58_A2018_015]